MTTTSLVFGLTRAASRISTTELITTSSTFNQHIDRIEIDATGGNITLTLPTITAILKNNFSITLKRIDTSANTVTIVGTGGNFEDEGYTLGDDPQLESLEIYASDSNIWRTV